MRLPPALLLVAVTLAGGGAGFLAFRQFPSTSSLKPVPAATGAHPAPAPAATPATATASAIPDLVPDVRLMDLAGKTHALRASAGRPRLYNFWATWCEPCRREIPLLNTLQNRHRDERLEVVGIAIDFRDAVAKFVKRTPLRYTLLVGEDNGLEVAQQFGMDPLLPFSVFADEHNRIVALKVGELHLDEADAILEHMRLLREGKSTLPATQSAITETLKSLSLQRAQQSPKG